MLHDTVALLKKAMDDAQEAANSDTKGSAGDKHETGRAMMHLEGEKNAQQLGEKIKLLRVLQQIKPDVELQKIQLGSLVKTNQGNFFIAIPLAKVEIEEHSVFCISPASPLGKELMSCEKGAEFEFNGRKYRVEGFV
jgi:transcription elongation GreA/GreB family factor